jgi:hypothetical protein
MMTVEDLKHLRAGWDESCKKELYKIAEDANNEKLKQNLDALFMSNSEFRRRMGL